jgi:type IX secretion system substrate protein
MKKIYTLVSLLVLLAGAGKAQTICTVDPQAQNTPGISPPANQLPCVIVGENYNQVIQVKNLSSYTAIIASIPVDSMVLDSIIGLPAGLDWIKSSNALSAGQNGCLTFFGTTTASPGQYSLTWYGTVWATVPILGVRHYTGNLNQFSSAFNYALTVINPGDPCPNIAAGINDFSADLNSAMYVYPNPNTGVFEFRLNAGKRINGEIAIYDIAGKRVFSQQLDAIGMYTTSIDISKFAKGLYTLQLRTADGFASKRISVE